MAITTNLDVAKKGGRISFTIDEPELAGQFFGFTRFEFGDDPHGPLMVVQVIPPDLEFATHYHDFYGDRSELPDKFTRDTDRARFDELMPTLLAAYAAAGMGARDADGATVGGP